MRTLLLSCIVASLFFTACKKKEESNPLGYWKLNGTTYNATSVARNGLLGSLAATSNSNNMLTFMFAGGEPTTSGTLRIPDDVDIALQTVNGSTGATYTTTYATQATANVTVTNGKIHIVFPELYVSSTNDADSVKFSLDLTEQ